ncbi:SIR2 family protein [Leptospira sp. 'Mane']|uniref:SIR2 family protein n=1 Tax=Leptospira sp. 'Mane' TaxID=3387407 RepID=UPI00398B997C
METNHNVYIIGAGYSVDAGMPLIKNFINKMREASNWLLQNSKMKELKAIEEVLNFRKEAASAAYRIKLNIDNIEQLFSLASASNQDSLNKSIIDAITATLDYCEKQNTRRKILSLYFDETLQKELPNSTLFNRDKQSFMDNKGVRYRPHEIDLYEFYALILSGITTNDKDAKNSIITLNYDLEIEKAFNNLKIPYTYNLENVHYDTTLTKFDKKSIPILKLHGSINWATVNNNEKLTIFEDYSKAFENGISRLLIPPTWQKAFNGPIQEIWEHSKIVLSSASRIIILGFSLPETDTHFKYLLAAGLKDNISLKEIIFVNPEKESIMMSKINSLFQPQLLENNQIKYSEGNIENFFINKDFLKFINRNPIRINIGNFDHDA